MLLGFQKRENSLCKFDIPGSEIAIMAKFFFVIFALFLVLGPAVSRPIYRDRNVDSDSNFTTVDNHSARIFNESEASLISNGSATGNATGESFFNWTAFGIACSCTCVMTFSIYAFYSFCRYRRERAREVVTYTILYPRPMVIPEKWLTIRRQIGVGTFGVISSGNIVMPGGKKNPVHVVMKSATKTTGSKADGIARINNEIRTLRGLIPHRNVVSFVGSYFGNNKSSILLEEASHMDLQSYLKSRPKTAFPDYHDFCFRVALDVACGLEHLASRFIIHRDLCLKNVLLNISSPEILDEDGNLLKPEHGLFTAKICDFGRAISDVTGRFKPSWEENLTIPWEYAPSEVLWNGWYTFASDVWSYGILLYKLFSNGRHPFPEPATRRELEMTLLELEFVKSTGNPKPIDMLIKDCTRMDFQKRITISEVCELLKMFRTRPLAYRSETFPKSPVMERRKDDHFVAPEDEEIDSREFDIYTINEFKREQ